MSSTPVSECSTSQIAVTATQPVNELSTWISIVLVACGGSVGAVLRFLVSIWFKIWFKTRFPYSTLTVNAVGSFVIGILNGLISHQIVTAPHLQPLIGTGFCGALTTFSTFSLETVMLLRSDLILFAIANLIANLILCLLFAWGGMKFVDLF